MTITAQLKTKNRNPIATCYMCQKKLYGMFSTCVHTPSKTIREWLYRLFVRVERDVCEDCLREIHVEIR